MPDTTILSGKEVRDVVFKSLTPRISLLNSKKIIPGLAVVLVGDNPASTIYVRSKTIIYRTICNYIILKVKK